MVKSKKRLICLAVVLLILATSLVGLVGCKSKNENIIEIDIIHVSDYHMAFDLILNKYEPNLEYCFGSQVMYSSDKEIDVNDSGLFNKKGDSISFYIKLYDIGPDFQYKGDKKRIVISLDDLGENILKNNKFFFRIQTKEQSMEYFNILIDLIDKNYEGLKPKEFTLEEKTLLEKSFKGLSQRYEIIIPNKDM